MRKVLSSVLLIMLVSVLLSAGEGVSFAAGVKGREQPTFSYFAPKANYTRTPPLSKASAQSCPCKNAAKADFVFMIDVTGSMWWCIESVKTNLQAFSESLINQ
ncbi:MAG: hypothetical protein IJL01_04870 [Synergistaceae bacterium]|nr:hypothetical protein [Synergistaceae bacterium]